MARASIRAAASMPRRTQLLGMTPSRFRAGGKDTAIRFAVGQCSLGAILVAATEKGVCAIMLGDDPDDAGARARGPLPQGAARRRRQAISSAGRAGRRLRRGAAPGARPAARPARHGVPAARVAGAARHPARHDHDLRRARAAHRRARRGARGGAAPAPQNPVAVAIPCHRVVRRDGALSGYRWGIERKRALLEREARP